MHSKTEETCRNMIAGREILKKVFPLEDGRIHTICAFLYSQTGRTVDEKRIENCRKMIKKKVSAFSEIRGLALSIISCMIDIRGGEELYIDQLASAYSALRKEFHASALLALGAEIIAEAYGEDEYRSVAQKAKAIYLDMKEKHPILTGQNDYLICILLAQSDRSIEVLGNEVEECYAYLKEHDLKTSSNSLQAVSATLALYEKPAASKCQKTIDTYRTIREKGYKYDKYYGIPMLAVLSQTELTSEKIADEMKEVNDWLKDKKGFGMLMGESSRMMYSAMIVSLSYANEQNIGASAAGSVISSIIAEQLAIIACISASTVAATASN